MSSASQHKIGLIGSHTLAVYGDDVWDRYQNSKEDAWERMDADELTNAEFVNLLLDVYDFHLDEEAPS